MLQRLNAARCAVALCAVASGFAPAARSTPPRCAPARLSPDREELRGLRVKELQAELGRRNIRWQTFLEKEELVVALSQALEAEKDFSASKAMTPGKVAELTAEQVELEIQQGSTPFLLDVYAKWCGPCQLMAPELEKAAAELGASCRVGKLDSDAWPQLAETLRVGGLPTLLVFRDGQEAKRVEGALMSGDLVQMTQG
mmetsp:Transcript_22618/g.69904  ORF Transcript_22618/g.69904 Transcript_22618/m.69904 type:complete len:199 (-) Transcript_22618:15-611(-)